jgi:hypothetical protein
MHAYYMVPPTGHNPTPETSSLQHTVCLTKCCCRAISWGDLHQLIHICTFAQHRCSTHHTTESDLLCQCVTVRREVPSVANFCSG